MAYAMRLGYSLPDAQDLVQIAYLVLLDRWHRGEPIGDWFGFLAGCTENSGLSTSTREQRRSRLLNRQLPAHDVDPGHEDRAIAIVLVRRALAGLSPADAELLCWHHLEDRPIQEIAERLEITEDAVRGRLRRALTNARVVLGPKVL